MPKKTRTSPSRGIPRFNSLNFISELFDATAEGLGVATQQEVKHLSGALRSRSYGLAVKLADSLSEQLYGDSESHFAMNQLASLIRKVPFKDPLLTPESTAWKKFLAAEHKCKRTNQRLLAARRLGRNRHNAVLQRARDVVMRVLGVSPPLPDIYQGCNFGPGASVGIHGHATHAAAKLNGKWTVTPTAAPYAMAAMMGDHHLWEFLQKRDIACYDPEIFRTQFSDRINGHVIQHNKITMVPKTAKVHRTIAIEPTLNGYIQKGVDEFMRLRLRRLGIDLSDQTRNQRLAREGSLGGSNPLVTIDLAAASDTVSIEIVKELLPPDWYNFLNRLRSPSYESEWGSGRYEKFVTMGNGFCFPLETLIFASLVEAVYAETGDRIYSVYGDDIIVRQSAALYLIEVLNYCGFGVNVDKTFIHGPFRESCGADFFEGVNVRPYVLDEIPVTIRDKFKILNGFRSCEFFWNAHAWWQVLRTIPPEYQYLRPIDGPKDTAINTTLDHFMSGRFARWHRDLQWWSWKELLSRPVTDPTAQAPSVQMYGLLRGSRSDAVGHVEFAFRRKTRTSTRWVPSGGHPVDQTGWLPNYSRP